MPTRKQPAASPVPTPPLSPYACPAPRGILIAIGGREEKVSPTGADSDHTSNAILRRFVEELTLPGPVLVVPIASEFPEAAAADYLTVLRELGVARVEVVDVRERPEVDTDEHLRLLEEAAGLLFTGGDQLRLTALLGGTRWLRRLKERHAREAIVIAGTSAGAAAMSTPMIYQGRDNGGMRKDEIHVTTGLQFLHDVAIDTHFVRRGRIIRMAQIIATNPGCLGLGLEEDTGVVIREGRELEVIGSGVVTIVEGQAGTATNIHRIKPGQPFTIRDLRLHILGGGECYTLPVQEWLHG
ncbi:cyanophycinase [uncultured Hymenobacter sp.]|uniref:cyanophycinase n=1 Tax=uncultured Hymenobacter sp. TaxID=170016 RepID=UPI0035CA31EC